MIELIIVLWMATVVYLSRGVDAGFTAFILLSPLALIWKIVEERLYHERSTPKDR